MVKPSTVTAEIDVDAPIGAVYNQWTQFESFPHFLHAVKEVTQHDDAHTHWVVSIGGVRREFDAEITEQVPDQLIAWSSIDGKSHAGSVRFAPVGDASTHVALEMLWLPETFVEKVGAVTPGNLSFVKALSGGSEAVESAMKFVRRFALLSLPLVFAACSKKSS